jgi:hypothetical protein
MDGTFFGELALLLLQFLESFLLALFLRSQGSPVNLDCPALFINELAPLLGGFRRQAVAVMHLAFSIDPLVEFFAECVSAQQDCWKQQQAAGFVANAFHKCGTVDPGRMYFMLSSVHVNTN